MMKFSPSPKLAAPRAEFPSHGGDAFFFTVEAGRCDAGASRFDVEARSFEIEASELRR
jgi:hypothetical protein